MKISEIEVGMIVRTAGFIRVVKRIDEARVYVNLLAYGAPSRSVLRRKPEEVELLDQQEVDMYMNHFN